MCLKRLSSLVFIASLVGLSLGGCAAPAPKADVTTFHQWSALSQPSFELARSASQQASLEHASYEASVRQALSAAGFVESPTPYFRVTFDYSQSQLEGRVPRSGPVVGLGGILGAGGVGVSVGVPLGGGQGAAQPLYTRTVHLLMNDLRQPGAPRIWESTAISEGNSAALSAVLPAMIQAMTMEFPGPSGLTRQLPLNTEAGRRAPSSSGTCATASC